MANLDALGSKNNDDFLHIKPVDSVGKNSGKYPNAKAGDLASKNNDDSDNVKTRHLSIKQVKGIGKTKVICFEENLGKAKPNVNFLSMLEGWARPR